MKCDHVIESVQSALDSGNPISLTHAAQHHLENCASCRAAVADLTKLKSIMTEGELVPADSLPPGFHNRLMERLSSEPVHSREVAGSNAIWWWTGVAALFVVVVGWFVAFGATGDRDRGMPQETAIVRPTPTPSVEVTGTEVKAETDRMLAELKAIDVQHAIPTPAAIYASVGSEVRDFGQSFYAATASLADSLTASEAESN